MEKTFHFVDSTRADRASKRLIRSHVMKGKNTGKRFHRSSRLDLATRRPYAYNAFLGASQTLEVQKTENIEPENICPTTIARVLGDVLHTLPFPLELTPDSFKIMNQFFIHVAQKLYPPYLCLSAGEAMSSWLSYMCTDEAASHCSIALMDTCNEFFFGYGVSTAKALHHLSKTFTLIKKRLESDDALSDTTLGIILLLIFQEQMRKSKLASRIHYDGLKKMIELRGGCSQLEQNISLLLKICKTDITYALQYGGRMTFFRDNMHEVRHTLPTMGFCLDYDSATSAIRHTGLNSNLNEVLLDVLSLSSLLNKIPPGRTLDLYIFQEMLVSIVCRLIEFRPLQSPRPESNVEAAYHIGLTIYMMSLFLQHDHRRILEYDLVPLCLREVLDNGLESEHDRDLLIWLMFIGCIWVSQSPDEQWLVLRTRNLLQQLGINTWTQVRSSVIKFPWLDALHEQLGRNIWNVIYQE
ncbi:hypothetical protein F5884DRAFT_784799 [Xylogone sp. PMI_703]|nr:hypothetical protein F5884DRAFT_784799 [Xylogone sp. PMI_703]